MPEKVWIITEEEFNDLKMMADDLDADIIELREEISELRGLVEELQLKVNE